MQNSGRSNISLLQSLLKQAPPGVFGGKDQAGKASQLQANATAVQMQNTHISPRQPEAWANYLQMVGPFREKFTILQAFTVGEHVPSSSWSMNAWHQSSDCTFEVAHPNDSDVMRFETRIQQMPGIRLLFPSCSSL